MSFRDAGPDDLETLVDLHVRLWARTYPRYRAPNHEVRRHQWRNAFDRGAGSDPSDWFCAVLAVDSGRTIGFAKGIAANHPGVDAELSKIYLEWSHHGLGIGRRLLHETVVRMLAHGSRSMIVFADEGNPHIAFYDRMGGERLPSQGDGGAVAFVWRDLDALAARTGRAAGNGAGA